jgi:hypothetical protein
MRALKLAFVFVAALFCGIASAFAATSSSSPCVTTDGNDDGVGVCDITARVVQVSPPAQGASAPSVALSNTTQTNYVKYTITLMHYAVRTEGFSQVVFKADTAVNADGAGPADFVKVGDPVVANAGTPSLPSPIPACQILTTGPWKLQCTFNFNPLFDNALNTPPTNVLNKTCGNTPLGTDEILCATISFDVTVKSPTGSSTGTLDLITETRYSDAIGNPESEYYALTTTGLTQLTVPDPTVVATYLPAPGTVTTGTTQGVLSCDLGREIDPNRWINIVKVPAEAQVGVNLKPFTDATLPSGTTLFSTLAIPGQVFGDGIPWYSQLAASKLLVITQKRHKCTIGSGNGTFKDTLIGLATKTYYKPDHVVYWPHTNILKNPPPGMGADPVFLPVPLCLVSGGPYLGEPCILYEYIDAGRNLIRVFYANENGRYGTP